MADHLGGELATLFGKIGKNAKHDASGFPSLNAGREHRR